MAGIDWQRLLERLIFRHRVPGASLSIHYDDGERRDVAAGILNLRTGYPATTDSLFLIGSITKVFTATLVLQLVEQGVLSLDDRVRELLPDLRFGPGPDPSEMRLEHLLNHTCGIESDHFEDFGRGEDALARHVASMAQFGLLAAPGERFSYSNSGYTIVGRLIEVALGTPYHQVLRERLLEPLGIARATTLAEEAILHRVAIGHFSGPDGEPVPTDVWTASRACEPEGMLCASSGDVLALGVALLRSAAGEPGALLARATVAQMVDRRVPIPALVHPSHTHAGLGLMDFEAERGRLLGHNGGIMGQAGCLRFNPDLGTGAVLLTSADAGPALALYGDLLEAGLGELLGAAAAAPAPLLTAPAAAAGPKLASRYERLNSALVIDNADGLRVTVEDSGPLLAEHGGENTLPQVPLELVGHGCYRLAGALADHSSESYVVVADDRDGDVADYVYYRGRLLRRAD